MKKSNSNLLESIRRGEKNGSCIFLVVSLFSNFQLGTFHSQFFRIKQRVKGRKNIFFFAFPFFRPGYRGGRRQRFSALQRPGGPSRNYIIHRRIRIDLDKIQSAITRRLPHKFPTADITFQPRILSSLNFPLLVRHVYIRGVLV